MKKLIKTLAVLAAVAALGFGFTSCGADDDDGGSGSYGPKMYKSTEEFQPSNLKVEQIEGTNFVKISFDIPTKKSIDFSFQFATDAEKLKGEYASVEYYSYGNENKQVIVNDFSDTESKTLYCRIDAQGMITTDGKSGVGQYAFCVSEAFQFTPVRTTPNDLKIEAKEKSINSFDYSFYDVGASKYYFKWNSSNDFDTAQEVYNYAERSNSDPLKFVANTKDYAGRINYPSIYHGDALEKAYIWLVCEYKGANYYTPITMHTDPIEVTWSK
ncbi:hypothetical protein [uncultured Treponema sp.]|uniref:hypothetical protein n=1 Tax=uncultured Treponema sp. TaxID=162155 RepID=UPI0025E68B0C|nr:hypothetical protein [uncultured Treponema sp.]